VQVVAADVKHAWHERAVVAPGWLLHRHRVHVGAVADDRTGQRAMQDADDAVAADPGPDLEIERAELLRDGIRGPRFGERQLGVAM
jgi:hypothetical protein